MPITVNTPPITKRFNYAIGDIQGCFAALQALKQQINFDETQDCLWFAGDLVARGEDSLAVLREVKRLVEMGAAHTVLGNHDLNLLAVWRGFKKHRESDLTLPILQAEDVDDLLHWLRKQPLLLTPSATSVLTHAGIPACWSIADAMGYAHEVESVLASDLSTLDTFLSQMYGTQPDQWSDDLQGMPRLRVIVNYFTRMRLTTVDGRLEFLFKDALDVPMPAGFQPWFAWARTDDPEHTILFGHWAALQTATANITTATAICPLDGGCVWGGTLMAYRLEDAQYFKTSVGCAVR